MELEEVVRVTRKEEEEALLKEREKPGLTPRSSETLVGLVTLLIPPSSLAAVPIPVLHHGTFGTFGLFDVFQSDASNDDSRKQVADIR